MVKLTPNMAAVKRYHSNSNGTGHLGNHNGKISDENSHIVVKSSLQSSVICRKYQNRTVLPNCSTGPQYQLSRKCVLWEASCSIRTVGKAAREQSASASDLRKCLQIDFRRGLNACIKWAARRLLKRPPVILAKVILRR